MFYTVFWYACKLIVNLFFRMEVVGAEKFPRERPVIVFSNHRNNWDPFILACHVKRPIHFMAKAELFKNPILGFLLRKIYAFPVNRGFADRQAIKNAMKVLENNQVLGIFPEGTRNPSGNLMNPEPGIALLAVKNKNVLLVPAALKGGYNPFSRIKLIFGDPYQPKKIDEKYNSKMLKELSVEIFGDVHKLMSS